MEGFFVFVCAVGDGAGAVGVTDVDGDAVCTLLGGRGCTQNMGRHSSPSVGLFLLGGVAHEIFAAGERVSVECFAADGGGVDVVEFDGFLVNVFHFRYGLVRACIHLLHR